MTASLSRMLVRAVFFIALLAGTSPLLAQTAVDGPPFSADPKNLLAATRKVDAKDLNVVCLQANWYQQRGLRAGSSSDRRYLISANRYVESEARLSMTEL